MEALVECVPNFSDGRDREVIRTIVQAITSIESIRLLHVDIGADANRTVVTFAGPPEAMVEAAFRGIQVAAERIDMRKQTGTHPRIGATDVCPLVPISGISLADVATYAASLMRRVGELGIPVFGYEANASADYRKTLPAIRKGGYEGMAEKIRDPLWRPDAGPNEWNPRTGATVIGARPLLIAWNVNLTTKDATIAQHIAKQIRASSNLPTSLRGLRAIGWWMEEYDCAQVSCNLTDSTLTVHEVYEAIRVLAEAQGVTVAGSELIGLMPLAQIQAAAKYYGRAESAPTDVQVAFAVEHLGLASVKPFDPERKILEFALQKPLLDWI
jgi:glutamate formiminotransferase